MTAESQDLARRFVHEVINSGNLHLLPNLVAADHVFHLPEGDLYGRDGVRIALAEWRAGFPDLRVDVEQMAVADGWVAQRLVLRGTHDGPFLGVPSTGRRVAVRGFGIGHVTAGRIAESWISLDTVTLLRQIGEGWQAPPPEP